ncbi:MAG: ATP-binding protein [Syntrophobacteraceae bacterium]
MKDVFIPTTNYQAFQQLCQDLLQTQLGLEMGCVIGPAGRGKTVAAERVSSMSASAVYLRYQERFSHVGLIRELAFVLCGARPGRTQTCFDMIQSELSHRRRIILVDECDRMSLKHLNTLRDFHDVCRVPVVLIGEEPLKAKLKQERRLESRVASELRFEPVSPGDVAVFYKMALNQDVASKQAGILTRHSGGDFRMVVNDALNIERRMKASGIAALSDEIIREVCGAENGVNGAARPELRQSA